MTPMKILVFGRSGQLANAIVNEAHSDINVVAVGRNEADLAVAGAAASIIAVQKPDIVINAAAYTAVDNAETDSAAAARLNAEAPTEIAAAANEIGALFIHVSTDYVFDGAAEHKYAETDQTNPLNIYGKTKRDGEIAVMEKHPDAVVLRTSWVFSETGANFVKTMLRLAETRDKLTIVADQIGGPTSARDIAHAILAIAAKRHRGAPGAGLYHFQGTPAVSWADFARKIFEIAGKPVDVTDITSAGYPTPAARPHNTILDCARIERDFGIGQPDWRQSLRQTIAALGDKETTQ